MTYLKRFWHRIRSRFSGPATSVAKRENVTLESSSGQGSPGNGRIAVPDDYKKIAGIIGRVVLSEEPNVYHESRSFSTGRLIAGEFERLGYPVEINEKIVIANVKGRKILFIETETPGTSLLGYRILKNKKIARKLFKEAGLSIAKGQIFSHNKMEKAKEFALNLPSAVLKPIRGNKSKGVTVGVKTSLDFFDAWNKAIKVNKQGVLVEEQFINGTEARYLVVGGKCIAVINRIPPHVIGTGSDTLKELITRKNKYRLTNPNLATKQIKLDRGRMENLKKQGYRLSSIPPEGSVVLIDWKAGISAGADSFDITDKVHPSFKQIAETVTSLVPGLDVIGVDILAHDHTKKAQADNYIVIEANTRPGIGSHHYPVYGKSRNVTKKIVEYVIRQL